MKFIIDKLTDVLGSDAVFIEEPMKKHTSFRVGGPADVLVIPQNRGEVQKLIVLLEESNTPYYIMGNGTNLLVSDMGYRGVIIKICKNLSNSFVEGNTIKAESGILLSTLSKIALQHNLSGLEFASGIPGTLGGAVTMNAGAYHGEMKDVVKSVEVIDRTGNIFELSNGKLELGYRTSAIQTKELIVLRSKIILHKSDFDIIKNKMDDLDYKRKSKQPLEWPSAGSTFKRPDGHFAGKLIQDSGLKGFQLGGAQVSEKHCGFIINSGNATATDIHNLIKYVQNVVYENFNVRLETEVKQLGQFN